MCKIATSEFTMKAVVCLSFLLATLSFVGAADLDAVWSKVDEGKTGKRQGSVLIHVPDLKQMLLIGLAKDAPFVQAFDSNTKQWTTFAEAEPFKSDFNNPNKQPGFSYQVAHDPGSKTIYCLSSGDVMYAFDIGAKTWKTFPPAPELADLAWPTLACDPHGKRLVVVGAEKKGDQLGWSRTVVFDILTGKWQKVQVPDREVVQDHRQLVAVTEALIDLGGRIRLAWYRDPQGLGTDAERAAIVERCGTVKKLLRIEQMATELDRITELVQGKKPLEALKATRSLQQKVEELAETQYPVPCARRNSPLVFDPVNKATAGN